ncbi:hypothetical protein ACTA71_002020 [Dictyostelium dimigraforme]
MSLIDFRYDITHFILSFLYFLLTIFCVISFIKRPKKHANTQQFVFYPLLILGVIVRSVFMFLQPFVMEKAMNLPNQANILLNSLPSFTFFSTYLIVLFIWVEIYIISYGHSIRSIRNLPTVFNICTCIMYIVLIVLYILDFTLYRPDYSDAVSAFRTLPEVIIGYYDVSCFILASLLFLFFGISLVVKFRRQQKNFAEDKRKVILKRITILTGLICFCFILRAAITLFSLVHLHLISMYWWFDGAYFSMLEVIPLSIMLYLLQVDRNKTKIPPSENNERTSLINSNSQQQQQIATTNQQQQQQTNNNNNNNKPTTTKKEK